MRRNIVLCLSLVVFLSPAWRGHAQEAPRPQQPAPPSSVPAPVQPAPRQPVQPKTAPPQSSAVGSWPNGDGEFSLGVFYWMNPGIAGIRTGKIATATNISYFDFPRNKKGAQGAEMNIPVGRYHTLRMSYFRAQTSGNKIIGNDINLFGVDYLKGQFVSSNYTLQNAKMSMDYTSWPFPVSNARLRVKTFWEVQYTTMRTAVDAPLEPTEDEDGNFVSRNGGKTHWFLYPSFGMGIKYLLSKHARFEMKGSGFYIPSHANIWDADALLAYRWRSWEIGLGARAFHFKTSPQQEDFFKGTLPGAYLGVRYYPK